jgi:hypothetical protein
VRGALHFALAGVLVAWSPAGANTFYVRQRAGNDANDGRSPATAWQHVGKLTEAMRAGDTAYVGPGLYREEIEVRDSGTADRPIVFVADDAGQHTGDPAGTVMLSGAEPADETIFTLTGAPGVYSAPFPGWTVWGVVEMDGPESRYVRVTITHEYLVEKLAPVDAVARLRSSWFHDEVTHTLYLHTSDDRPPAAHDRVRLRTRRGTRAAPDALPHDRREHHAEVHRQDRPRRDARQEQAGRRRTGPQAVRRRKRVLFSHGLRVRELNVDVKIPAGGTQEVQFTPQKTSRPLWPGAQPFCFMGCSFRSANNGPSCSHRTGAQKTRKGTP